MGESVTSKRGTINYLNYLSDHPEIVTNQPPCASAGSYWLQKALHGKCKGVVAQREMNRIIDRWEAYHDNKAKSLGWELDLNEFRRLFSQSGAYSAYKINRFPSKVKR